MESEMESEIKRIQDEMAELRRLNKLLIERLTYAMDKISRLEEKNLPPEQQLPYHSYWDWYWD
jgi:predicted nuclease with TOPRIM domain